MTKHIKSEANKNSVVKLSLARSEITPPKVMKYVTRVNKFMRQSAESVIELSTTIIEAEQQLSDQDFKTFCDTIRIEKDSSTYSKHKKIAAARERLLACIEKLPHAWTTIYEIAKLSTEEFCQIEHQLHTNITVSELNSLTKFPNEKSCQILSVKIDFTVLDSEKKMTLFNTLRKLENEYEFKMTANNALNLEIESLSSTR